MNLTPYLFEQILKNAEEDTTLSGWAQLERAYPPAIELRSFLAERFPHENFPRIDLYEMPHDPKTCVALFQSAPSHRKDDVKYMSFDNVGRISTHADHPFALASLMETAREGSILTLINPNRLSHVNRVQLASAIARIEDEWFRTQAIVHVQTFWGTDVSNTVASLNSVLAFFTQAYRLAYPTRHFKLADLITIEVG